MKLIRLIQTLSLFLWIGIGQASAQFDVSFEVQEPSCNGYSDGVASAIVDGGSEPYSYLWSNGETNSTIYGLTIGDVSVTVTDANGASEVASTSINEPAAIDPSIELAATANICNGSNLDLIVSTAGGTSPYTYEWSTGTTEESIIGAVPGSYTVTVTDANGCSQTDIYIINETFELNLVTIDVICANFCDGSAEAEISGGIPPYTFAWNNGGTSEVIDLLEAGEYSVTVTDGNGCTLEATGIISEPENMFLTVNVEGSCEENAIITAEANANGGTPPYTFSWSNGAIGEQTSDIIRGTTYFVTVTDANGCNIDEQIYVPLEPGLVLFPTVQNAACDSGDGGSASVMADGGTEPYLYSWSTGASGSSITNLTAGTYTVTATDVNGCKGIDSVIVNDGTALLLFTNMVNASCSGMADGMANVLAEGGQGPYIYQWNDNANQTNQVAINLLPGEYTVTVTDQLGCMGIETVLVGANTTVSVDINPTNPTCEDSVNGIATATASGGAEPYTYVWATGQTTATISNLLAGSYSVTATDANGCSGVQNVNLSAETNLAPDFTTEITTCDEDNNVTITLTGTAIADISSWDWNINGESYNNQLVTIVVPNGEPLDIQLTVSTADGCEESIEDNMLINLFNVDIPDVMSCIGEDVQLNANPDLEYNWTPEDIFLSGQNTPNPILNTENPLETTATVIITHPLGCTMTQMIDINIMEEIIPDPSVISTQQCEGTSVDFAHTIDGIDYEWNFGDNNTSPDQEVTHIYDEAGIYDVTLSPIENQGCAGSVTVQVEVMEAPEAAFVTNFEDCTDGTITFMNMSNVPEDATYSWVFSNGEMSDEENPIVTVEASETIMATLTINFGDNCELTVQQEVDVNVPPVVDLESTLMVCAGEPTELNEGGGDDNYIYTWDPIPNGDPNDPNPSVTIDETMTYNVTITDASGACEVTDQVTVQLPPAIVPDPIENVNQCDNSLVNVTVNSVQAENYEWYTDAELTELLGSGPTLEYSPEERNEVFYIVFIDTLGCSITDSISISNNAPQVELTGNLNLCAGDDIQLQSTNLVDGDELTYDWTPADMLDDNTSANPTAMPEDTTTYVANIINQFGCMLSDSVTINVIDLAADLQVSADPATILNGESTNLTATQKNNYEYVWTANNPDELNSTNIFNPTATPVINTSGTDPVIVTYNVMVMDENGCVADRDVEVEVLQSNCVEPFIFLPNAFTPNGDDINDILFIRGYSITDVFLIIYNRWGEKVFETNSIENGWDGRHKGELVCPDVYGYYLEVECFGGEMFTKKGNVTVLK